MTQAEYKLLAAVVDGLIGKAKHHNEEAERPEALLDVKRRHIDVAQAYNEAALRVTLTLDTIISKDMK